MRSANSCIRICRVPALLCCADQPQIPSVLDVLVASLLGGMIDRVVQCCKTPICSCKSMALCWTFTELDFIYQSPYIRLIYHAKGSHQLEFTNESELHDDPDLTIAGIARRKEFLLKIADYIHKMSTTGQHKTQHIGDISNQRASKACNRCRAKKSRCSGGYPCSKCKSSDAPCIFGYSKVSKRRIFPEQ